MPFPSFSGSAFNSPDLQSLAHQAPGPEEAASSSSSSSSGRLSLQPRQLGRDSDPPVKSSALRHSRQEMTRVSDPQPLSLLRCTHSQLLFFRCGRAGSSRWVFLPHQTGNKWGCPVPAAHRPAPRPGLGRRSSRRQEACGGCEAGAGLNYPQAGRLRPRGVCLMLAGRPQAGQAARKANQSL